MGVMGVLGNGNPNKGSTKNLLVLFIPVMFQFTTLWFSSCNLYNSLPYNFKLTNSRPLLVPTASQKRILEKERELLTG